jgi:hypothetical protein
MPARDEFTAATKRRLAQSEPVMAEPSRKILCIDDEREAAALIAEELVDRGFDVWVAHDGHEGFAAILREAPDLVLCDISVASLRVVPSHAADVDFCGLSRHHAYVRGVIWGKGLLPISSSSGAVWPWVDRWQWPVSIALKRRGRTRQMAGSGHHRPAKTATTNGRLG